MRPGLLAVDSDPPDLRAVERELRDRNNSGYSVRCTRSADQAVAFLEPLSEGEEEVALVLAARRS